MKLNINTAFPKFVTLTWHVSLAVKLSDNKAFSFLSAAARFYIKGFFLSRESTLKQLNNLKLKDLLIFTRYLADFEIVTNEPDKAMNTRPK